MKKSLLSVGAASFAAMFMVAGCSSTDSEQFGYKSEVEKANKVVQDARGLEEHKKLADKYLLPNLFLENTKVLYIDWAATATDLIEIRFGEADVVQVCRDSQDTATVKMWDAIRNADADKAQADAAEVELKKYITESYAKNKTVSKLSDDEIFATVVGKIAQEEYIAYQKQLKDGDATEADYKDQKSWLEKGKANVNKVADEQKKLLAKTEKRLAKAEEDAKAARRKIELTVDYAWKNGIELPVAQASYDAAVAAAEKAIPEAEKVVKDLEVKYQNATDMFSKKALETSLSAARAALEEAKEAPKAAKTNLDAVKKALADIKKEFPEVDTVFEMPELNFDPSNPQSVAEAGNVLKKELDPWFYSLNIGVKRWDSCWEVRDWANEAQKTLEEVSGEK